LDKSTGQLRLKTRLDYEDPTLREWNLLMMAQMELGNAKKSLRLQSAPVEVHLTLTDSNDNCPEFTEIPVGHLIQVEQRHLQRQTPLDAIIWTAKVRAEGHKRNNTKEDRKWRN
jgi:hypothetical protein